MKVIIKDHPFLKDGEYDVQNITINGCLTIRESFQEFQIYIVDRAVTQIIFFDSTKPVRYIIE